MPVQQRQFRSPLPHEERSPSRAQTAPLKEHRLLLPAKVQKTKEQKSIFMHPLPHGLRTSSAVVAKPQMHVVVQQPLWQLESIESVAVPSLWQLEPVASSAASSWQVGPAAPAAPSPWQVEPVASAAAPSLPCKQKKVRKKWVRRGVLVVTILTVIAVVFSSQGNGAVGAWTADTLRTVFGATVAAQIEGWYLGVSNTRQQLQYQLSNKQVAAPWKVGNGTTNPNTLCTAKENDTQANITAIHKTNSLTSYPRRRCLGHLRYGSSSVQLSAAGRQSFYSARSVPSLCDCDPATIRYALYVAARRRRHERAWWTKGSARARRDSSGRSAG